GGGASQAGISGTPQAWGVRMRTIQDGRRIRIPRGQGAPRQQSFQCRGAVVAVMPCVPQVLSAGKPCRAYDAVWALKACESRASIDEHAHP
ncbi:MAG: hypothetical protein L0K70_06900, partial [Bifidobacterium crudilactis]|nr:hypothetical protein [Bifidobacterium crudilactis]